MIGIVIESVHAATITELNLSAATNLVMLKLGCSNVLRVHSVDLYTIQVSYDEVKARGMDRHRLDQVRQCFHCLQSELAWVSRVLPDHECLVTARCCQDLLLHASCDGRNFVSVERNRQVRNLTKVISLFFLNAHFEHLALFGRVDKEVANLVHAGHREVDRVLLG